jgi:hypothetical protein
MPDDDRPKGCLTDEQRARLRWRPPGLCADLAADAAALAAGQRPPIARRIVELVERLDASEEGRGREPLELSTGLKIASGLVEAIVDEINARGIDVLIIDPFVSSHSVSENDNVKIDQVIKECWSVIAERANCCVCLVHHTRKVAKGATYSASDARGASAIIDAARDVRVYNVMTKEEAEEMHIGAADRWRFFRIDSDKPNMAPRGGETPWRILASVSLGNAQDGRPADKYGRGRCVEARGSGQGVGRYDEGQGHGSRP